MFTAAEILKSSFGFNIANLVPWTITVLNMKRKTKNIINTN